MCCCFYSSKKDIFIICYLNFFEEILKFFLILIIDNKNIASALKEANNKFKFVACVFIAIPISRYRRKQRVFIT